MLAILECSFTRQCRSSTPNILFDRVLLIEVAGPAELVSPRISSISMSVSVFYLSIHGFFS